MRTVTWTRFGLAAVVLGCLTVAVQTSSKAEDPQPGRVIDRVPCREQPDQTYSLYLPSNYSPSRTWSLIAAFDPGARGIAPVERFKEAAERYGYIVCGSNNSRNGPWAPTAEAAEAMLKDVTARFAIDEKRIYLTGFSGGARVATRLAAALADKVAGVIGCGAGFSAGIEPTRSLAFVYYGTVGTEDFNYPEMKRLERALEAASIPHHLEVFEGGHSWAPAEVCRHALEWMELQAMKSARRSRDEALIDRLFSEASATAASHDAAERSSQAYAGYVAIAAAFKGLKDVSDAEKKIALLKDSKAVAQALKLDREQETEQRRRVTELFALRAKLRDPKTSAALSGAENALEPSREPPTGLPASVTDSDSSDTTLSDLKRNLADLKRRTEAKESTPDRALARRVLSQFTVATFEQSMTLIQTRKYDLAASNLEIDAQLMPDNWRVLYNLACAYALKGDKRRAISALETSVRKGFAISAELERNPQLDAIREEPGFKKILDALKQKQ